MIKSTSKATFKCIFIGTSIMIALAAIAVSGISSESAKAGKLPQSAFGFKGGYTPLTLNPGQTYTKTFTVVNAGTLGGTAILVPGNALTGGGIGGVVFSAQTPLKDLATWISFSKTNFTLQPGKTDTVTLTINVPSSATPGYHAGGMVLADTTGITSANPGMIITILRQSVMPVVVTIPGGTYSEALNGSASVSSIPGRGYDVNVGIANNGTLLQTGNATFTLTSNFSNPQFQTRRIASFVDNIMPGDTLSLPLALGTIHSGSYTLQGSFTTEQGQVSTLSCAITIP
jgi:hypothetical protein